ERIAPFHQLKLGVNRGQASHAGILRSARQLPRTPSDGDRALIVLDMYRRMVEGQLRPWAWALLRASGRSSASPPTLGSLRNQLVSHGHPVMGYMAEAILPAARNAAAHEDAWWDASQQTVVWGNGTTTVPDLVDATERAYALMCGAECAWSC